MIDLGEKHFKRTYNLTQNWSQPIINNLGDDNANYVA